MENEPDDNLPQTPHELVREIINCIGLDVEDEIVDYLVAFNTERVPEVIAELEREGAIPIIPENNEQNTTKERIPYTVLTSPISSVGDENPSTFQTPSPSYPTTNEENPVIPRPRYEVPTSPISSDEGVASTSQTQE